MTEQIKKTNRKLLELENAYTDKEIAKFIYHTANRAHKDLVTDIIKFAEANDYLNLKGAIEVANKLSLATFKTKHVELIAIAVVKYLERNYEQMVNRFNFFISFLSNVLKHFKKVNCAFDLDWRLFYKIFSIDKMLIFQNESSSFYKLLHFFIESTMNEEDYHFLKKEVLNIIYHYQKNTELLRAINIINCFMPKKFIENDKEFQCVLFNLMKNRLESCMALCEVFKMLMKGDALKVDVNEFIEIIFSRAEQYISGNDNVFLLKMSPSPKEMKKKYKRKSFGKNLEFIIVYLLFGKQFEKFRNVIDVHMNILIQNLQIKLHEKYNEDSEKTKILTFLSNLFCLISQKIFMKKQFDVSINKSIKKLINAQENIKLYERYINLIENIFWICIKKICLLEIPKSNFMLNNIIDIIKVAPKEISFSKFDEIVKYLKFLKNEVSRINTFAQKFSIMIPLFLLESNYTKHKDFFISSLTDVVEQISSGNPKLNFDILSIFTKLYTYLSYLTETSPSYPLLKEIEPSVVYLSEKIIKKILPILDIFIQNSKSYHLFAKSLSNYKPTKELLSKKITDYLINSEIDNKYIEFYMTHIVNHEPIFKFCIEDIIYINEEGNYQIKKHCLYKNECIKQIEVTAYNEKKILFYKKIFENIDFSSFSYMKYKKEIYNIIFALFNQKNNKYFNVASALINNLTSLLQIDFDSDKKSLTFPSNDSLQFIIDLYKEILLPYETYIKDSNNKDENTILIYAKIAGCFVKNYNNIFINYTEKIQQFQLSQATVDLYEQYNNILINVIKDIDALIKRLNTGSNEEGLNVSNINLLYDIIYAYLDSICSSKSDNDDSSKLAKQYANYYKKVLNDYSKKKIVRVAKISYDNIYLFKLLSESKGKIFCENLLLSSTRYDVTKENIQNVCNNLKFDLSKQKEYIKTIDEIYTKSISVLGTMNSESISFSDTLAIEIIVNHFYALTKLEIFIKKYHYTEISNKIMKLYMKAVEKKYKKLNEMFFLVNDFINIFNSQYYTKNSYFINKITKYPQIAKLEIKKIKPSDKYNLYYSKFAKEIEHASSQKEKFENEIIQYVKLLYPQLTSNQFTNNEIEKFSFMLINLDFIFNILDYKSEENISLISQFESLIYQSISNPSTSSNIKKMWLTIFFIFLRHKYKSNLTYKIATFTPQTYQSNFTEIIMNNTNSNRTLNSIPIDYTSSSFIEPSQNPPFNIDINSLYESLYKVNDWSVDKNLMTENSKNPRAFISELIRSFSAVKSNGSNVDMLTALNSLLTSCIKNKFSNQNNNSLNVMYIRLVEYLLIFGYIKQDAFTYEAIVKNLNKKEHSSYLTVMEMLTALIIFEVKFKKDTTKANSLLEKTIKENFTNGINNQEDGLVYSMLFMLVSAMTLKDVENVLIKNNILDINENLTLRILLDISNKFKENILILTERNKEIVERTNKIVNNVLTSTDKFISNFGLVVKLIQLQCLISNGFDVNDRTFERKFNTISYAKIEECVALSSNAKDDKLQLSLYNNLFCALPNGICDNVDLLCTFISLIAKQISQEAEQVKNDAEIAKYHRAFSSLYKGFDYVTAIKTIRRKLSETSNNKERMLLLLTVKSFYINNLHFLSINSKHSNEEIYVELLQLMASIKEDESLKDSFSDFFVVYYNNLSEEENKKIISKFEDCVSSEDNLHALIGQLLRFKLDLPEYIQKFIVELGKRYKKASNSKEGKIIKNSIIKAMNYYHNAFLYMSQQLSEECKSTLKEISANTSYFI